MLSRPLTTIARPVAIAAGALTLTVGLGACSYEKGGSSESAGGSTAVLPTIRKPLQTVVGLLPPIGGTTSSVLTVPITTVDPNDTTTTDTSVVAPTRAPRPSTSVSRSTSTSAGASTTTTSTSSSSSVPTKVSVQAGAFTASAAAIAGLANLQAAGFSGFAVVGSSAPYKLMRGNLNRSDAQQLVSDLTAKGFPALLVAH